MYHLLSAPLADAPEALDPFARFPAAWWMLDLRDLDPTLRARTGQAASYSRSASASITDSNGTGVTAVNALPPFDMRDTNADTVRDRAGLLLGANDVLAYTLGAEDQAFGPLTIYAAFVETGGRSSTGGGLLYVGNDAVSGGRVTIQATGSTYKITFEGGGATRESTLPFNPATNDFTEIVARINADFSVQIWGRVNGGGWQAGNLSATTTTPGSWPASTRVRIARKGSGGTACASCFMLGIVVRASRTTDQMTTRY